MYFTLKNLSSLINSQSIPALHFTNPHSRIYQRYSLSTSTMSETPSKVPLKIQDQ